MMIEKASEGIFLPADGRKPRTLAAVFDRFLLPDGDASFNHVPPRAAAGPAILATGTG